MPVRPGRSAAVAAAPGLPPGAAQTPVEWSYVSPPPVHLVPGDKTGRYRAEVRDTPLVDEHGDSRISVGDYAAAVVDTVENGSFVRARFTVGYRSAQRPYLREAPRHGRGRPGCLAPGHPSPRPGACTGGSRLWLPVLRLVFQKDHLAAET